MCLRPGHWCCAALVPKGEKDMLGHRICWNISGMCMCVRGLLTGSRYATPSSPEHTLLYIACVAVSTTCLTARIVTLLWSTPASHTLATQVQQCIAKPGFCVSKLGFCVAKLGFCVAKLGFCVAKCNAVPVWPIVGCRFVLRTSTMPSTRGGM